MAKCYRLRNEARNDLRAIVATIARDNPSAAQKMKLTIFAACSRISEYPQMGQLRADLTAQSVRFWPVHPNYMIIYHTDSDPLQILRIYHAARDIDSILTH